MSRSPILTNLVVLALILLLCLTGLLFPMAAIRNRSITRTTAPVQWSLRDYAHYVGWQVGIYKTPPFVYLVDEIQLIEPESTILDQHPEGVRIENPR